MSTFGTGGSPQGSMRWIAELDTRQFKQGTSTLKQEFTSLGQSTRQLTSGVNPLASSFNPLSQNINKTSTAYGALGANMKTLQTNLDAQGRGLTSTNTLMGGLGTTVGETGSKLSKLGSVLKNNLTSVGVLAGGIAGLDNQFLALHKAQVGAERANLILAKANNRVEDTQARLNKMVKEGKEGTAEYNALLADFKIAQEGAAVAAERQTVAQENLNERTEDFWIGILPNALFIAGSATDLLKQMGSELKNMGNIIPRLAGAFSGLNGAMLGIGGAFAAASVGIGALLIPNLAELADIIAEMSKPGADMEALSARIEDFKNKISNTDPISKFLFEISRIKEVATNVSAEIDRINLGKTLDENILGSLEFKSIEPHVQEMVKSRVDYIKRILANPKNWVVEKTNIRGQTFIDKEATQALVANTSKVLMEGFDDIRNLIYDNIGSMPQEIANAFEEGVGIAEPQLTKVVDSMVTLLDTELGKAIIAKENRKAIDAWEEAQLRTLDPTRLKSFLEGKDIVGKTADVLSQTLEFAGKEAEVDKATKPLIDKMTADMQAKLAPVMTPMLTDSLNDVFGAVGGNVEWEQIIGGIKDPKLRDQTMKNFNELSNTVVDSLRTMKEKSLEQWNDLWAGFKEGKMLKAALDIEVDQDKIVKKILDYMPDSVKKDIKIDLKTAESVDTARKGFEEIFAQAADRVDYDDSDIDKVVNGYVKYLAEKFPKSEKSQQMQDALAATVAGEDTETKVKELLAKWNKLDIAGILTISETDFSSLGPLGDAIMNPNPAPGGTLNEFFGSKRIAPAGSTKSKNAIQIPAIATINSMAWGGPAGTIPELAGSFKVTSINTELPTQDDTKTTPEKTGIQLSNTMALKTIDVVAKRIDSLSTIQPIISLMNNEALKVNDVVAVRIFSLETIEPQISLKNRDATKVISATAKGIMNLEDLKPQIQLKNRDAFKVIAATAKEIMDLEDLTPTITVQVEYEGIKKFAEGGHFITDGPQVIMVGDNPTGKEEVTIEPLPHGSKGGPGFGTRNGRGPGGLSTLGFGGVMEFHVHNILMDREINRTYRQSMGQNQSRYVD